MKKILLSDLSRQTSVQKVTECHMCNMTCNMNVTYSVFLLGQKKSVAQYLNCHAQPCGITSIECASEYDLGMYWLYIGLKSIFANAHKHVTWFQGLQSLAVDSLAHKLCSLDTL